MSDKEPEVVAYQPAVPIIKPSFTARYRGRLIFISVSIVVAAVLLTFGDLCNWGALDGRDVWINISKAAGKFFTSAGAGGLAALTAALIALNVAKLNRADSNHWEMEKLKSTAHKDESEQRSKNYDRTVSRSNTVEDRDDARWWSTFQMLLDKGESLDERSMSGLVRQLSRVAANPGQGSPAKVAAVLVLIDTLGVTLESEETKE